MSTNSAMSYIVRVQLVNEDKHVMFSDFEDDLGQTKGEIFRHARDEFGRCQSKIFLDYKDGSIRHVGWYFVKRNHYGDYNSWDKPDTYLQGAWVTVYQEIEPERPRQLDAADLGGRP